MAETHGDRTVLVVGAGGHFAGLLVPELQRRGVRTRAFIRRAEERDVVLRNGATEVAEGDLADAASVGRALADVDSVFYIAPQFLKDEARIGVEFVQACKGAGVRRFVQSSILHPAIASLQVHAAKAPVEAAVVESGMDFTILQLSMFYQDMTAAWPRIVETRVFEEPFSSKARVARVDFRDVAEVAAIALTEERLVNGTFELCADGFYSREDVAAIMSEVLGFRIEAGEVPFARWAHAIGVKAEECVPESAMYAHYGRYGSPGNSLLLNAILGRKPRTLQEFFNDLRAGVATVAS